MAQLNNHDSELWDKITTCEKEISILFDEINSLSPNVCVDLVAKKQKIHNLSKNLHNMCVTFYKGYHNEKTVMAHGLVVNTHEDWML